MTAAIEKVICSGRAECKGVDCRLKHPHIPGTVGRVYCTDTPRYCNVVNKNVKCERVEST